MITASSLARLRACPSSAVLSRAETQSAYADAGNVEHEELSALDDLPASLASAVPAGARSEVKLAYDVATHVGRIIGEGSGRDYGKPGPFEIVGSCDVLAVDGDRVIIIDWKTGYADVEPAASNAQLWFYALAACRALGIDNAVVRIVYTKTERVDEADLGPLELAEFASQLEHLHARVAERHAAKSRNEILDTREGSWCKHCPSKAFCPSKNALLVQIGSGGLAVIGDAAMTPERAADAYRQVMHVEQLVKDARKRLDRYVEDVGPIDIGNGQMYGRYSRKGNEKLDGNVAVQAIRDVVGESAKEFESVAIERKVTKAGIKRAAEHIVQKGATKLTARIVERIRELGGAESKLEYPIGEFAADKKPSTLKLVDPDAINSLMEGA